MKNILISLGIVIIWVSWYIAWIYYFLPQDEAVIGTQVSTEAPVDYQWSLKKAQESNENDAKNYSLALEKKQWAICESIKNTEQKLACKNMILAIQALDSKNTALCVEIQDQAIKTQCQDRIGLEIAREKWDKSLCSSITDSWSISYCRTSIDEENLRKIIQEWTASETTCSALEENLRETCIRSIAKKQTQDLYIKAIQSNSIENCELIEIESEKNICLDTVHLKKAVAENNISLCANILSSEKRDSCESLLEKKNDTIRFKELISTNNREWCSTLSDTVLQNRCSDTIALSLVRTSKDSSLCDTLTQTWIIATCKKIAE